MQFLLFPPPLEDEWIGSWLVRLADANVLSWRRALELLGSPDFRLVPDENTLRRLAVATHVPFDQVASMVLLPEQTLQGVGTKTMLEGVLTILGVKFLQVCPQCFDTDPIPYIRKHWLLLDAVQCRIHGGPLLDHCPGCRRIIRMASLQKKKSTSGPPVELLTPSTTMKRCTVCKASLIGPDVPLRLLPPTPTRPGRYGDLSDEQLNMWPDFILTIKEVITTFAVAQINMLEVENTRTSTRSANREDERSTVTLPQRIPDRFSAKSRFEAEMIFRTLFNCPQGADLYEKLHEFASGLTLYLQQANVQQRKKVNRRKRWLYAEFIFSLLERSSPREHLTAWPAKARFLTAVFLDQNTLHRHLSTPEFRLNDEQWQLVDEMLMNTSSRNTKWGDQQHRRNGFESFMYMLIKESSWWNLPLSYKQTGRINADIIGWSEEKYIAAAELLYRHLRQHQPTMWETSKGPDRTSWQVTTTALFTSDRMLELFYRNRRDLFNEILTQLAYGYQVDL